MSDTPAEPVDPDPETFPTFVADHDIVLIDAWAAWCGPCKQLEPAIEELAAELDDVAVGTVDHEAHPDLMSKYRSLLGKVVSTLPALFVFREGDCVERTTGTKSAAHLRAVLDEYRWSAGATG